MGKRVQCLGGKLVDFQAVSCQQLDQRLVVQCVQHDEASMPLDALAQRWRIQPAPLHCKFGGADSGQVGRHECTRLTCDA